MEYDAERDFHPESWTLNFSDLMMTGMLGYGNTSGSEFSMEQPNLLHEGVWRYVLISLFAIVIIFGFLENLLVFVVIVSNKQLHTVTNIFICTLAFSDIYMCVLSLPFQLHYGITNNWDFGKAMCHVIYPLFGVPIFTSTLAILMIAVERFVLIVFPFRRKMSKKLAIVIVTVIVFISVCIALPVFMFTDYQPINIVIPDLNVHIHKAFCTETWSSNFAQRAYTMFVFVVQFFIPYIVICVLYSQIYLALKNRPRKQKERRKNYRTTRILVAITIMFTISWLPFQIFSIALYFMQHQIVESLGSAFHLTDLLLKIIAMSSACINPFFYGWLNDNFRRELGLMLGKKMKKLHVRTGLTTTFHNGNEIASGINTDRIDRNTATV